MHSHAIVGALALLVSQAVLPAESANAYTFRNSSDGMMDYVPLSPVVNGSDLAAFLHDQHLTLTTSGVRLAPGNWSIMPHDDGGDPKSLTSGHIVLDCSILRTIPFTLDLAGSYIRYMNASIGGIALKYCTNVTISGPANFSYVADQLPHMEAKVIGLYDHSKTNTSFVVQVAAAYVSAWDRMLKQYPLNLTEAQARYGTNGFRGAVYDNNTGLQKFVGSDCLSDFYLGEQVDHLFQNVYNLSSTNPIPGAAVNDILVVKQPDLFPGVSFFKCSNCTLKDLHIFAAAGVTIGEFANGLHNIYQNVSIVPDPAPGPDGHVAVLSSNADGLHVSYGKEGPHVHGCRFVGTGDDTINIQSSFYTIVALNPANHTVTLGGVGHKDLFSPGENVTAYMSDGVSLGSALITKVTGVPAPYPAGTKVKLFNPANPMVLGVNDISIELVLAPYPENFTTAQPLQAFLSMPSREGAGFVIEDNYFAGNRGRGTHAGSNGGVIARNKIVDVCFSGISMTPDSSYSDANFASNIVVQSNYIDTPASGITLETEYGFAPYNWPNKNISVLDNTVVNSQAEPLKIDSAENVTVEGNTFHNCFCFANTTAEKPAPGEAGAPFTPIIITNSKLVAFANNNFTQDAACQRSKANYTHPVYTVNTTQVTGLAPPPVAAPAAAYLQAPYPGNHTGVVSLGPVPAPAPAATVAAASLQSPPTPAPAPAATVAAASLQSPTPAPAASLQPPTPAPAPGPAAIVAAASLQSPSPDNTMGVAWLG